MTVLAAQTVEEVFRDSLYQDFWSVLPGGMLYYGVTAEAWV